MRVSSTLTIHYSSLSRIYYLSRLTIFRLSPVCLLNSYGKMVARVESLQLDPSTPAQYFNCFHQKNTTTIQRVIDPMYNKNYLYCIFIDFG